MREHSTADYARLVVVCLALVPVKGKSVLQETGRLLQPQRHPDCSANAC